ncbi:hypothetical protein C7G41_26245 [Bradyrhizobium sp. MOS002]|nr:hypothetical protein C7G41_26245 [Bradyrhizobium sp. MOS002]
MPAQRSNPESLGGKILDCFAALAMTTWRVPTLQRILVPRTQRSASWAVRCRAGAHVSACRVAFWVPALRSNATRCSASGTRDRCLTLLAGS